MHYRVHRARARPVTVEWPLKIRPRGGKMAHSFSARLGRWTAMVALPVAVLLLDGGGTTTSRAALATSDETGGGSITGPATVERAGPAAATGRPALRVAWATAATHVGVPVGLTIDAVGADGEPEVGRSGAVSVLIDDGRVRVEDADGAEFVGVPAGSGRRVTLALVNGRAAVTVTFATPGQRALLATLAADPEIAGESAPLAVAPVFFALEDHGPVVGSAARRLALTVHDEDGSAVTGYAGRTLVRGIDSDDRVNPAGGATNAGAASPVDVARGRDGKAVAARHRF